VHPSASPQPGSFVAMPPSFPPRSPVPPEPANVLADRTNAIRRPLSPHEGMKKPLPRRRGPPDSSSVHRRRDACNLQRFEVLEDASKDACPIS
jgi:hypothetical protein